MSTHSIVPPLKDDISVSFEFFPPSNAKTEADLWHTLHKLSPLNPKFASVTYGAGGSTQDHTVDTVTRIHQETTMTPASHLTIAGATKAQIRKLLNQYQATGINHIIALRGDPPQIKGQTTPRFTPHPSGFQSSIELIEYVADLGFETSVSAYPETHPCAKSPQADIEFLKQKADAGASRALTQFFFDADAFLRFRDKTTAAGINIPIVPGVLPVTNYKRIKEFAKTCGTSIPDWFHRIFDGLDEKPKIRELVAVTLASELCLQLKNEGVNDFHFYTLNKWEPTDAICNVLGIS